MSQQSDPPAFALALSLVTVDNLVRLRARQPRELKLYRHGSLLCVDYARWGINCAAETMTELSLEIQGDLWLTWCAYADADDEELCRAARAIRRALREDWEAV